MRTSRPMLAVVGAVLLTSATAVPAVAQAADESSYLTGTMTFVEDIDSGSVTEPEGLLEVRGASAAYNLQMSDPGVSGTLTTLDYSLDGYGGERLAVGGGVELVTMDGTWAGSAQGIFEPMMGWQLLYRLDGQGELDGQVLFLHAASPELADGVWEIDGFVAGGPAGE